MEKLLDFIILFLSQFAGGPGPVENNLIRFGLPTVLWACLLYIAWSRQRAQDLPREKLLVWGFGLALVRELYMFGQMAWRLLGSGDIEAVCDIIQPLEHGLAMAAMIVVAGAFLRFILDSPTTSRRYLQIGLGITMAVFIFTSWTWPRHLAAYPQIKFHQTWAAWLFHVPLSILMGTAVVLLWRKRSWLRNVVASALTFYLVSELLLLLNYATARAYNGIICPIGNSLHILAIPLLGYVYLREQAIEKEQAENALIAYRDHLEELVGERTAELTTVNTQLKQEIFERTQAEEALERITQRDELILESAGEGICGIDRDGRVIFANPAAARMLGFSTDEMINQPCYGIWHPPSSNGQSHPLEDCPITAGYSQGIQRYGDDEYFWRRDGTGFPVRYFSNPAWEKDVLAGVVLVFQDITERKRSEAEIAQRNASLATQNAVAATLSQSLEIEENLKNVLAMVQAESGMEIGLIFLVDPDTGILTPHLHIGLYTTADIKAFTTGDCACIQVSQQALIRKQAVTANPATLSPRRKPSNYPNASNYLISIPLVSKGRAIGVMTLGTRQPITLQPTKIDLLTAIGQQIGMAIENARLYQDTENWAEELVRLHEASSYLTASFDPTQVLLETARQSARLLKCQKACIVQLGGQQNQPELAADFGMNRQELQIMQDHLPGLEILLDLAHRPKITAIYDAEADFRLPDEIKRKLNVRAALFVPIWAGEIPHEFLILLDCRTVRRWRPRKLELIESLMNRAAVALVNARLHQQLELAAALQERQRIAANMHDGLAQTLSLLGLRVDRMHELVENDANSDAESAVREIRDAVTQASKDVRRSIASLQEQPRPPSTLQEQLEALCRQLRSEDGPDLQVSTTGIPALFLPQAQVDQVLPVIQEAILNAKKHAQAKTISICLEKNGPETLITVADDGHGFDPDAPHPDGDHFGLSIMQARAARIRGALQVDSAPGNGTSITLAWVPEPDDRWNPEISRQQIRTPA